MSIELEDLPWLSENPDLDSATIDRYFALWAEELVHVEP
jgi:hypothetical protein